MRPMPNLNLPWPVPLEAVALMADAEGCRLRAYRCPAGVATVGWGHTGADVVLGKTVWTQAQADQALLDDIAQAVADVQHACTQAPTAHELGALVSFAYNCRGWRNSTVLRQHNAGNPEAAARAFALWNKARNPRTKQLEALPGLTRRRAAEAALYLKALPDDAAERMPQAVAAESRLTASPIAQGGAATAVTGVGALAAGLGEQADQVGAVAASVQAAAQGLHGTLASLAGALGMQPATLAGVVLLVAGWAVLRWRRQQRQEGWA